MKRLLLACLLLAGSAFADTISPTPSAPAVSATCNGAAGTTLADCIAKMRAAAETAKASIDVVNFDTLTHQTFGVIYAAPPAPGQVWTKIAAEGSMFTVAAGSTVRYGMGTAWVQKVVTAGAHACSNLYFGSDPLHLTVKQCELLAGAVTPPPPPVVGSAKLSWSAPTTNADGTPLTDLAGYRIYYGTAPGVYGPPVVISSAATLTATITPLGSGPWYFIVRAVDTSGNESVASAEVSKVIP